MCRMNKVSIIMVFNITVINLICLFVYCESQKQIFFTFPTTGVNHYINVPNKDTSQMALHLLTKYIFKLGICFINS